MTKEEFIVEVQSVAKECFDHTVKFTNSKEFQEIENNISTFGYGSISPAHRGYLCPSPVMDLYIGNFNRGVKKRTVPKKNVDYYKYGFDSNGKLLMVYTCKNANDSSLNSLEEYIRRKEYVFRYDFIEYSFNVEDDGESINALSRSVYNVNNNIIEYHYIIISHITKLTLRDVLYGNIINFDNLEFHWIWGEKYTYDGHILTNFTAHYLLHQFYDAGSFNLIRDDQGVIVKLYGGMGSEGRYKDEYIEVSKKKQRM